MKRVEIKDQGIKHCGNTKSGAKTDTSHSREKVIELNASKAVSVPILCSMFVMSRTSCFIGGYFMARMSDYFKMWAHIAKWLCGSCPATTGSCHVLIMDYVHDILCNWYDKLLSEKANYAKTVVRIDRRVSASKPPTRCFCMLGWYSSIINPVSVFLWAMCDFYNISFLIL